MTIKEAEKIYEWEVTDCIESNKKQAKKKTWVRSIIFIILIVAGIVLTVKGFTAPPEIDWKGEETESFGASLMKAYGIILICVGAFCLLLIPLIYKEIKNREDFSIPRKNLYYNYLKCEDMSQEDKEYYIQKLEEIRNDELVAAIHRGSADASAAILFTTLRR